MASPAGRSSSSATCSPTSTCTASRRASRVRPPCSSCASPSARSAWAAPPTRRTTSTISARGWCRWAASARTAATPNEAELEHLAGGPTDDEREVDKAGRQLLERLDARFLLVTRGSRGMALLERDGATTFIPVHGTDEIADVTGAGDTVISAFTLALASGAPALEAATLANVAGGIVVMKRGTATVLPSELRQAITLHDS